MDTARGIYLLRADDVALTAATAGVQNSSTDAPVSAVVPSQEDYLSDAQFLFSKMAKSYTGHIFQQLCELGVPHQQHCSSLVNTEL